MEFYVAWNIVFRGVKGGVKKKITESDCGNETV